MKIVQVTYTTKPEYVAQNKLNIQAVMSELQNQNHSGVLYTVCLDEDGKTFIHTAYFNSDEDEGLLTNLPLFRDFQQQLQASGLESLPQQKQLGFVGSSRDLIS